MWRGSRKMTGKPYRCSPRPNGSTRLAPAPRRPIPGVTRSARTMPTATAAAASGTTGRPHRSDRSSPMRSASTTWTATCGSGCRIAGRGLRRGTHGWLGVGDKGLQASCRSRRFLGLLSRGPPLGLPLRRPHRRPELQSRLPGREDTLTGRSIGLIATSPSSVSIAICHSSVSCSALGNSVMYAAASHQHSAEADVRPPKEEVRV